MTADLLRSSLKDMLRALQAGWSEAEIYQSMC